ncbi:hypothetical protein ACIQXA_32865 [Streptomyces massasporeus]|uniref:hypothetical protein n=1 Tax=Streptomyces massasporeus TaxID=67324 RepID=UPI0037FF2A16
MDQTASGAKVAGEMTTAWIAAGSAVAGALAGGAVTGWFTLAGARKQAQGAVDAAARQADAAWEAGRLQVDAQLDVARQTLTAQHLAAQREVRRAAYAAFLVATNNAHQHHQQWQQALGTAEATACRDRYRAALLPVTEALTLVRLEGLDSVAAAAEALQSSLDSNAPVAQHQSARTAFLDASRTALTIV